MSTLYLSLGSNLGDKQKNIEEALRMIDEEIGCVSSVSSFHVTEPEGFHSEHLFVNCVCEAQTDVDIDTAFAITQKIEKELGRKNKSKNGHYSDRPIDIDIILADDTVIENHLLTVPHPKFHLRSFVLAPLCEIAPQAVHPLLHKTMEELYAELLSETESKT